MSDTVIPWVKSTGIATSPHSEIDVRAIRKTMGMTQIAFAQAFGFTLKNLRAWEKGERISDPTTRVLLTFMDRDPDAVKRALTL